MVQKISIDSLDTATLVCPSCGRRKVLQVSTLSLSRLETRVKANCACGRQCHVILVKQDLRKSDLQLPGTYATPGASKRQGRMTVKRLNSRGLVFMINTGQDLPVGQKLCVELVLDDVKQSIVKKEAVVLAAGQRFISARFSCPDHFDNLGPYLFFNRLDILDASVSPQLG